MQEIDQIFNSVLTKPQANKLLLAINAKKNRQQSTGFRQPLPLAKNSKTQLKNTTIFQKQTG